ncbi:hypothetical protein ACP70R_047788 [Stipagrostis hirtigluma subsp. patula]
MGSAGIPSPGRLLEPDAFPDIDARRRLRVPVLRPVPVRCDARPGPLGDGRRRSAFGELLHEALVADTSFIMDIIVKECGHVFQGVSSLVDVAVGLGTAAQTIAKAFPHVKCSVLDLRHVVANAPVGTGVDYIAGDMFESIPSANAVFLKWILHDWGDAECVKLLKNCKKAIPSKEEGGKVIILDMVVGTGLSNPQHKEMQVLFDLFMMFMNGIERDEQQWKKIILEAGYSGYKIIPIAGIPRSIIEVYP